MGPHIPRRSYRQRPPRLHRYIRTTQQHDTDGTIYNYDGMVAPDGGEPGVEDPAARVASPKADAEGHGGKH